MRLPFRPWGNLSPVTAALLRVQPSGNQEQSLTGLPSKVIFKIFKETQEIWAGSGEAGRGAGVTQQGRGAPVRAPQAPRRGERGGHRGAGGADGGAWASVLPPLPEPHGPAQLLEVTPAKGEEQRPAPGDHVHTHTRAHSHADPESHTHLRTHPHALFSITPHPPGRPIMMIFPRTLHIVSEMPSFLHPAARHEPVTAHHSERQAVLVPRRVPRPTPAQPFARSMPERRCRRAFRTGCPASAR